MPKKSQVLNMRSSVRTLSIKCYDEQMPDGWDTVKQNIRLIDKRVWQVIGICHDRDYVTDEFWLPALEKKHYHVIVRALNGGRPRVEQILRQIGIVYRPIEDKSLWINHGVETCKDFTNMTVYLNHDTEEAINDGKEHYELEELVSNLSLEEIKQIREGYTRVSESTEKITPRKLAELDRDAYELGRNLGDFDKWWGSQPFTAFSNAKSKYIRDRYNLGVDERLEADEEIPRLCVFVQGAKDVGKSYAARYACRKLGLKYLRINGGGTGRFDQLTVSHDAIIIDDRTCPNLLNMSDVQYCRVYRRNKNNPPWVGHYLIVTSNYSFDKWLDKCGVDEENKEAARSRFLLLPIFPDL